jgi:site-specific DNA-methyltransferase (adenine-specific)
MVGILEIKLKEEIKQFEGSYAGVQFKPSVEIILLVQKPLSEKTFVDQALSNGKGITWLDDGRIPYQNEDDKSNTITGFNKSNSKPCNPNNGWNDNNMNSFESNMMLKGRFPANLLVSDDVLNDGKIRKSGKFENHHIIDTPTTREIYGKYKRTDITNQISYGDSGSFSRYFSLDKWFETTFPFIITPKPSKAEKNRGLDKWISQKVNDGRNTPIDNPFQRGETLRVNTHVSVKPIKLMSWLVTLLTRPDDVVLDPFLGSGTTAIAAKMLKRNYVGIEREKEYADIAERRLAGN